MKLFIIGNGFDLAHGIKTSYFDFRNFLEENYPRFLEQLENMHGLYPNSDFSKKQEILWKDFESNLPNIIDTELVESGSHIDMGVEIEEGIEDTLDEYWRNEFKFIEKLNEKIEEWIMQINIDKAEKKKFKFKCNKNTFFFTFNYTLMLEKIYRIKENNILHIHGDISGDNYPPAIGHGNEDIIDEFREKAQMSGEKYLEKEASIFNALANYHENTLKDINYFMRENSYFFQRISNVDKVVIMGISFGKVDIPYLEKIKNSISNYAIWEVYYYKEDEEKRFRDIVISIGISSENIIVKHTNELYE